MDELFRGGGFMEEAVLFLSPSVMSDSKRFACLSDLRVPESPSAWGIIALNRYFLNEIVPNT